MKPRNMWRTAPFVSLALLWGPACSDQKPAFEEKVRVLDNSIIQGEGDATPGNGSGDGTRGHGDNTAENGGGSGGDGGNSGPGGATLSSVTRTFQSTSSQRGNVIYDWNTDRLEQVITMEHSRDEETVTHQQATRARHTEMFAQGSSETAKTESFNQNDMPSGLLDIVVVVDNSGSMKEEQANLSTKLNPLLAYVQDSDWRINVVTTDPANGCMRALIAKGDANAETAFRTAVTAGTNGTGNEQGVLQAVNALKCDNASWVRPGSAVAVLIVSDEDNCSDGQGCGNNAWSQASYLMNHLKTIRQPGVNAKVYGLIWHPSMGAQQCSTALNKAYIYADLIAQTNGTYGAICDADYSATLRSISQNISVILQAQFPLAYAPLANTISVYVNDVLKTSGYTITGNVLKFDQAPPAGATIRVEYRYFTTPPLSSFVLSRAADPQTLEVTLDGNMVNPSDYAYDEATRKINFYAAPVGREVRANYMQRDGLSTDFAINGPVDPTTVSVYVNDQLMSAGAYSIRNDLNVIRFNEIPSDGATISIYYIKGDRPRYNYPVFAKPAAVATMEVFDEKTLASVPYSMNGNTIVFPAEQFRAGRKVVIAYQKTNGMNHIVDVNRDVRLVVEVANEQGSLCDPVQVGVSGSSMDLSKCAFAAGDRVHVEFAYVTEHVNSFTMDDSRLGNGDSATWEVWVNDQATTAFTRQGLTITIPGLPYDSRVVIRVSFKN